MNDMLIHLLLAAGFTCFVYLALRIKKALQRRKRRQSPHVFRSMFTGVK